MERPEIYTDNYNSLEEWIELRKRNEEFVYPQFFVPFREWMKDIEQKSDMEIKELLRILLQPYTLGVDTVDTYGNRCLYDGNCATDVDRQTG